MRGMDATSKARLLRRSSTDAERKLWRILRNREALGLKFRRQQPLGQYIVDFVCFERRLVIELDGGQHLEQAAYDAERDEWLESQGFRVMRFWDNQVLGEVEAVKEAIFQAVEGSSPSP
jgi:very-short-patch-repair endonuclease